MCAKEQNLSDEQKFEQMLFHSLKYYGYLFPGNIKDVDRFEELYGDTEIEIPEHLQSPEILSSDKEIPFDFDFSLNVAAFSANDTNSLELSEDIDLNDEEEELEEPFKE